MNQYICKLAKRSASGAVYEVPTCGNWWGFLREHSRLTSTKHATQSFLFIHLQIHRLRKYRPVDARTQVPEMNPPIPAPHHAYKLLSTSPFALYVSANGLFAVTQPPSKITSGSSQQFCAADANVIASAKTNVSPRVGSKAAGWHRIFTTRIFQRHASAAKS